jgi:sterol 3beta-glucosyltransferase
MFRKAINHWRTQTWNLLPISKKEYFRAGNHRHDLILNGYSPIVVERPGDWSANVHITGYWFPEDPTWTPSPALERFIERGLPPIFIGFGSMPIKDPKKTTRLILAALKRINQRAVLHLGWGRIGTQDLPDSIYLIDYAPYEWLFPKMGMVIHHGGSGTTGFGLRSGVPSCAIPLGFDQIYWGRRIAAVGAGPKPIRIQTLSSSKLAGLIQTGVHDDRMRKTAAVVGHKIQSENGIQRAVQLINQNMNY